MIFILFTFRSHNFDIVKIDNIHDTVAMATNVRLRLIKPSKFDSGKFAK